jgi:biopolymer transport protein ExbD
MKFSQRYQSDSVPEINLVPMMDVLMTVLTFFIILAMTLTAQLSLNVQLPGAPGSEETPLPEPLTESGPMIVSLGKNNAIQVDETEIDRQRLKQEIVAYFAKNPKGTVFLQPSRQQSYEFVLQLLGDMRAVGGDRVSLIIDDLPNQNDQPNPEDVSNP